MAASRAWADGLCRRLAEPWRAYEFWDKRYRKAQTVSFSNVKRETGYSMEYIIEQRQIFLMKILDVDLTDL